MLESINLFYLNLVKPNINCTKTISNNIDNGTINRCNKGQKTTIITPQTNIQPSNNHWPDRQQHGFSFIEVMIVIAILSILLSTAIPGFNTIINKSKLSNTNLALISSLSLARDYAITSGHKTHLCALTFIEPMTCQEKRNFNANWSQGWMVFADINDNNKYDLDDIVLHTSSVPETINVVFNQQGRLRFFPDGSARSAGFYLCDKNLQDNRHIKLLYSGRARTTKISISSQLTTCLSAN